MPSLRVEFIKVGSEQGGAKLPVENEVLGAQTLTISATEAVSNAAPDGTTMARLEAVGDQCYVDIGRAPDTSAEPRAWFNNGAVRWLKCEPGEKVACDQSSIT